MRNDGKGWYLEYKDGKRPTARKLENKGKEEVVASWEAKLAWKDLKSRDSKNKLENPCLIYISGIPIE